MLGVLGVLGVLVLHHRLGPPASLRSVLPHGVFVNNALWKSLGGACSHSISRVLNDEKLGFINQHRVYSQCVRY